MIDLMDDSLTAVIRTIVREELARRDKRLLTQPAVYAGERQYSVKSAAALLDTSEDYVLARIKDGSLPRFVDLGSSRSKLRIPASELQRFIDNRTVAVASNQCLGE